MPRKRSVLVVEDDAAVRAAVVTLLAEASLDPSSAGDADQAIHALREREFDAVLSDIRMPGRSGMDLLAEVRSLRPGVPVVLMTGFATIDSAVQSMQAGACDYVSKPLKRDKLLKVLGRAFEQRRSRSGDSASPVAGDAGAELVGSSPAMLGIRQLISKIADHSGNVLIRGETGTGKDRIGRAIHASSRRRGQPYVAINCAAIPEGLLESELFGHMRGAFTGAVQRKHGLFQAAHGGTLFLDEIGDVDIGLQSKLLRALEAREVRPVGGNLPVAIDVRIIAATNRDLRAEIEEGSFRRDLFYRLDVIRIVVPPLRERPEDIAELAKHFLERHAEGRASSISDAALERLSQMTLEGNARELENIVQRALALGNGHQIEVEDLVPDSADVSPAWGDIETLCDSLVAQGLTLREIEDEIIRRAMKATGGNKLEAARILGIGRRTMYRRYKPVPGRG